MPPPVVAVPGKAPLQHELIFPLIVLVEHVPFILSASMARTILLSLNLKKYAAERNGISKADAVYIGDTEGDEKATRFAGIPFVWAKYGFGKALSPDAVLNDIKELPALLSSLL